MSSLSKMRKAFISQFNTEAAVLVTTHKPAVDPKVQNSTTQPLHLIIWKTQTLHLMISVSNGLNYNASSHEHASFLHPQIKDMKWEKKWLGLI